jgi:hypothetical protein
VPACRDGTGCPVGEDLASDIELNEKVDEFLRAKALTRACGDPLPQRRMLRSLKLFDEPNAHLQLEVIYARWTDSQRKRKD